MAVFLRAEWRKLAMLNYEVDPAILERRVPAGTTLDSFAGKTYVSVVGFMFTRTVVKGIPIPFHRDFEEVNLRFYVRRRPPGGHADGRDDRRGVVFVKELVPRFAIAWVARVVYRENYVSLPMRHRFGGDGTVEYGFRVGGRWAAVSVRPEGEPERTAPGSLAEFIAEHYWGYAAQADGGTKEYQVEHPPWRVQRAQEARLDCDVAALYGPEFAAALSAPPSSAFLAEGSPVTVGPGVRIAR
jgi:uncharacterized protein YqjF (DUF2071 family)